jgi:NitT/TauT family transport system permease protein
MSEEHKEYLRRLKRRSMLIKLAQAGLLLLFFGLWELFAYYEIIDPFLTSSPSRVINSIYNLYLSDALFIHMKATLAETMLSFALSTFLGTLIAVILWWNETIRRILEPYIIVLNALPKIALGPLIIIWAGAGKKAIIVMAFLICIIITIISMLTGFLSIEKGKMQLLQSMKANKFQILYKLVLPGNIPTLVSVLKINVGLSWVGTIMGEYLVSREGIGYLLVYGSQIFKLDLVMASTILLCVLATAMYLIVALAEKIIKRMY